MKPPWQTDFRFVSTLLLIIMLQVNISHGKARNQSKLWRTPSSDGLSTTLLLSTDQSFFKTTIELSTMTPDGVLTQFSSDSCFSTLHILPGQYDVQLLAPNYRQQRFYLNTFKGYDQYLDYKLKQISPSFALTQSLLFPGAGQIYLGQKKKAFVYTTIHSLLIATTVISQAVVNNHIEEYDIAEQTYRLNRDRTQMTVLYNKRVRTYNAVRDVQLYRDISLSLLVFNWSINLFDISKSLEYFPKESDRTLQISISPTTLKFGAKF